MNRKVLIFFAIGCFLIIFAAVISKLVTPKSITAPTLTPIPQSIIPEQVLLDETGNLKYAQGDCQTSADCTPAGCSAHICSNDPGLITDCALPPLVPSQEGYSCGCIQNKCSWYY